ncbi:MAG: VWA domain-containing protein [Gemmatimonadales bacterium]|nr:MAG: VWA domain-containing protein [Gemmatimonadales bacterium]
MNIPHTARRCLRSVLALLFLIAFFSPLAWAAPPAVRVEVTLDRPQLPAGSPQTAVIKVALDAPALVDAGTRPPINLTLVLDRSGSMSGEKLGRAREAALEALRRLGPRDIFALVTYDHTVETVVPAQPASNSEWIEARIRSIGAGGNTALFAGVSQGAAEVRKHLAGPYIHRIVLLSDGLANVGPSSADDLGRLGGALLKEGISVTTIGVGTDFNEDLMTRLAARSDGNHYFVAESRDLPRIFASELGDVLSVVARKVIIEIECPGDVRPLRIIGREGRISGQHVEIGMNQLYGGQQKYVLIEVETPAGRPQQRLELARVKTSYENSRTSRQETANARAEASFTASAAEVRRSASPEVYKAVVENEMAASRDKALDLYNSGKREEAARELKDTSTTLQEKGAAVGLGSVAAPAAALSQEAAEFQKDDLSPSRKKEIRSESFKSRNQQKDY